MTRKRRPSGQARVGVPEALRFFRNGAYKAWHSGCHTEWANA